MTTVRERLDTAVVDPRWHAVLALVKGLRNGVVYGAKIRFPHALVMTLLYRGGSPAQKLGIVLRATRQHAWNLGRYVLLYKLLARVLNARLPAHWLRPHVAVVAAGCLAGWTIFGTDNAINQQIVLYVFSRVCMASAKVLAARWRQGRVQTSSGMPGFPFFAAGVWGAVMWLFEHRREMLQPSLQSSMEYLYADSDMWNSLRTLVWHNK